MGLEVTKQEIGEAAGHLLAELSLAQDEYRQSQISKETLAKRVAAIREVAARFRKAPKPLESGTLAMILEDVQ